MTVERKLKINEFDLKKLKSNVEDINFYVSDNEFERINKKSLSILNEILKRNGITLTISHIKEFSEYRLEFYFNTEQIKKSNFRGAGNKVKKYNHMTVSQLIERLNSKTKHSDIIAEIGCPRANYFRILKIINNSEEDLLKELGDVDIFIFYEVYK